MFVDFLYNHFDDPGAGHVIGQMEHHQSLKTNSKFPKSLIQNHIISLSHGNTGHGTTPFSGVKLSYFR